MAVKTILIGLAAISQYAFAAPIEEAPVEDIFARADISSPVIEARDRPLLALRPVQVPAGQEPSISQQVVPQSSVSLHYAGAGLANSTTESSALVTIPKVTYPIVNAVGASVIGAVDCTGGQARVHFTDRTAFAKAADTWSKNGPFTLVTFSSTCGTGLDDSTHDFLLAHNVVSQSSETLSILLDYTDIQLEDAVDPNAPISVKAGAVTKPSERFSIGPITIPTTFKPSYSKNIKWNKYPSNAISPWGAAYKFFDNGKLQTYCVGCGTDGDFALLAQAEFTLLGKFNSGSVSIRGAMNAAAVFGLVGTVGVTVPLPEVTLAQLSIEGLSIPGIFSIGPTATISAGGSLAVKAAGQLEAGAKLHWPKIQATLDLVKSSATGIDGWKPTVEPVFNAKGAISSTLDLHLTNTLAFGVSIPKIKFNKQVALIDQPGVQVTAGIEGSAGLDSNGKVTGGITGPCKGVSITANFYNRLTANLFNIKTFKLADWTSPSASKCIPIPGLAAAAQVNPQVLVTSSTARITSTSSRSTTTTQTKTSSTATSTSKFAVASLSPPKVSTSSSKPSSTLLRSTTSRRSTALPASTGRVIV